MYYTLLIFIVVLLASIFAPGSMMVILIINTAIVMLLSVLQIFAALFSRFEPRRTSASSHAFVSVLIPTYNEPPAILMYTLEALSRLKYENFEVLVIDNNTKDPAVWQPVETFTRTLGERFRFFHVDELSGYKAGALNYILNFVNPKSAYTAVIDADYVVEPEFLNVALSYFVDKDIALVQFPQQYRNCTNANQPIADEYRHFFKIYMNMANHMDCVPSTGTVSVYALDILRSIGGFREEALTEDADVGLRIYGAGYRGVYVDHSMGYGLMPYDIESYRKQKKRWATGNAQSIRTLFSLCGRIPFRSWLGFLSHLTAWDHFNLLPFAVLAAYSILLLPIVPLTAPHRNLLTIASLSIFITLTSKFALFVATLKGQKRILPRAIKAFIVHMGMTLLYSQALGTIWFGTKVGFERTNKFILAKIPSLLKNTYRELILGIWFAAGTVEAIFWGTRLITVAAFLISSLTVLSIYYVYWKISSTKAYSQKLLMELEREYRPYLKLPNT